LFVLIFPLKKSGQKEYLRDLCGLKRSPDKSGESGREKHNPVIKYNWRIINVNAPESSRYYTKDYWPIVE